MKDYIEKLNTLLTKKEQEKTVIKNQITQLQEKKAAEQKVMQAALDNADTEAFLASHVIIQDCDMQLKALQDLLEHKEKTSNKPEVIAALNNAIEAFEAEHKKDRKKYQDAKRALCQQYIDACHAENELKKTISFYMAQEGISDLTGEVKKLSSMEPKHQEAARFFRDDLINMGYDFAAIMTAQSEF